MKHLYLTTIILILAFSANAQNWQPFYANDEVHYTITDSFTLTNTIVVDKITMEGTDSIYHFNTIMDKCDTCVFYKNAVLLNAPDFLGYTMTFSGDGIYKFKGKTNFVIDATKGKGEDWIFDTVNNIIAAVIVIKEEQVLGELDSVKYIYLTSGKGLRLSKHHGITAFPFEVDGGDYELIGIQNRGIGERVPEPIDFFNYKVGDVFEYGYGSYHSDNITKGYYNTSYVRYEILNKVSVDKYFITYEVLQETVDFYYKEGRTEPPIERYTNYKSRIRHWMLPSEFANPLYFWNDTAEFSVNKNINSPVDLYRSLYYASDIGGYSWWGGWYERANDKMARVSLVKNLDGDYYKVISNSKIAMTGFPEATNYNDLSMWKGTWRYDICDTTDEKNIYVKVEEDNYGIVYKEGVGFIMAFRQYFESSTGVWLEGCRINGVEYGTLGNIHFNTSVETVNNSNISIYPNPATNQVTIRIENYSGKDADVKIYNTSGQVVMAKQHNFTTGELTIDVATLPKGIYYVKIEADNIRTTQKLIVY